MGKGIFPEAALATPSPWKVEVISQRACHFNSQWEGLPGWGVVTVRYLSMAKKKVIRGGIWRGRPQRVGRGIAS